MLKNKSFLVVVVLLALIPLTAFATASCVAGLGGAQAVYVLHDASTPNIWPQLVASYPNLAGGEFSYANGTWDLQKVYCNYSWGENASKAQFSIDKRRSTRYTHMPVVTNGGIPSKFSAIWGMPMSDWLIGASLSYEGESFEQKAETTPVVPAWKRNTSVFGIKLGASGLENKALDLALAFETADFKNDSAGTTIVKNDGSMMVGFTGRYWYKYSDKCALIPVLAISDMVDGAKNGAGEGEKFTTMNLKIGAGHNWTPRENLLVLFDFGFLINSTKTAYSGIPGAKDISVQNNNLPYWRLGVESKIFDWLNGRVGAEKNWLSSSSDDEFIGKPATATVVTNTFLGATAHWNRLVVDMLIAPSFLNNGPYFVSGAPTSGMFSQVSLFYNFNKE